MELVALLIDATGERLRCLLNPESLKVRRRAGVRARRSLNSRFTGPGLSDDPLLYTGGGTTELTLDLLFDTNLAGSSIQTENVRELTAPLWQLAENLAEEGSSARPPLVRLVWGKVWNIPGVVAAVSERFEYFNAAGAPRTSWLRMKLIRVAEQFEKAETLPESLPPTVSPESVSAEPGRRDGVHEVAGGADPATGTYGEGLSNIAFRHYGNPSYWRLLAWANDLDDPLHLSPGSVVSVPSMLEEGS